MHGSKLLAMKVFSKRGREIDIVTECWKERHTDKLTQNIKAKEMEKKRKRQ
jgi:hypothetical protein